MSKGLEDPLGHASLVGRFQYHFARVEQKIDQAVIKLLDLDEKAAIIVTGDSDFAKKLNRPGEVPPFKFNLSFAPPTAQVRLFTTAPTVEVKT